MRLRWPWIVLAACGPAAATAPTSPRTGPNTSAGSASASPSALASGGPSLVGSESGSVSAPAPAASSAVAANADLSIEPWAPKGAVTGVLELGKPLTAHGVSLVLTRSSHKEKAKGGVVGVWEWELRKGGAKVADGQTDASLLAETAGFGTLALLVGDGSEVRATLVPWTGKPFTDEEVHDFAFAEHERRKLPKPGTHSMAGSGAGIYTITWSGTPPVRMTIGLHSRRVLAVSIGPNKT